MKKSVVAFLMFVIVVAGISSDPVVQVIKEQISKDVMACLADRFPQVQLSCIAVSVIRKSSVEFSMMIEVVTAVDGKDHYIQVSVVADEDDCQWTIAQGELGWLAKYMP